MATFETPSTTPGSAYRQIVLAIGPSDLRYQIPYNRRYNCLSLALERATGWQWSTYATFGRPDHSSQIIYFPKDLADYVSQAERGEKVEPRIFEICIPADCIAPANKYLEPKSFDEATRAAKAIQAFLLKRNSLHRAGCQCNLCTVAILSHRLLDALGTLGENLAAFYAQQAPMQCGQCGDSKRWSLGVWWCESCDGCPVCGTEECVPNPNYNADNDESPKFVACPICSEDPARKRSDVSVDVAAEKIGGEAQSAHSGQESGAGAASDISVRSGDEEIGRETVNQTAGG